MLLAATVTPQRPLTRTLIAALVAATLGAAISSPTSSAASGPSVSTVEGQIRACVNRERAQRGLPTLRESSALDQAARYHAGNMARYRFFDHTDPQGRGPQQRVHLFDSRDWGVGENIAAGEYSAGATCRDWMHSPEHRANILDRDYRYIGGGFASGGPYGDYYVQDFGILYSGGAGGSDTGGPDTSGSGSDGPHRGRSPEDGAHHVVVDLFNVDDQETLYLNRSEVATVRYGDHWKVDLGQLRPSDRIKVRVTNAGGAYAWGISAYVGGRRILDDRAGSVGSHGANNGDRSSTGLVHSITFNDRGAVSDRYTVRRRTVDPKPMPSLQVESRLFAGLELVDDFMASRQVRAALDVMALWPTVTGGPPARAVSEPVRGGVQPGHRPRASDLG